MTHDARPGPAALARLGQEGRQAERVVGMTVRA
jgi:hypothetical protein